MITDMITWLKKRTEIQQKLNDIPEKEIRAQVEAIEKEIQQYV